MSILNRIHIHITTYIFGLLCILTGLFKAFISIYLVIFIHELGHIIIALLFDYKIKEIDIYPFGGYIVFDYDINSSFISELLVSIGGILSQFILYLILIKIYSSSYIYNLTYSYNITMLIFNTLPLIPLDGSKVLNIIINKFIPFKYSHLLSIYLSYILSILLVILFYKNINIVLVFILIIILIIKEHKNHIYVFNRFLLERYIKNIRFKKNNFINSLNINKMKKYKYNIFIYNNKYLTEKNVLTNKYKNS